MDLGLEVSLGSKAFCFVSDDTVTRTLPSVKDAAMVDGVSSLSMASSSTSLRTQSLQPLPKENGV